MSKHSALWEYASASGRDELSLSFDEIDRSLPTYKRELSESKISTKEKTVTFERKKGAKA